MYSPAISLDNVQGCIEFLNVRGRLATSRLSCFLSASNASYQSLAPAGRQGSVGENVPNAIH